MLHNSLKRFSLALVIVTACMQSLSVALAADGWPMFQHDAGHSGFTSLEGPNIPTLKWMIPLGKRAKATTPPAVSDSGNIYVGVNVDTPADADSTQESHSGVFAFDDRSKLLWISEAKGIVPGSLAIGGDGTVYAQIGTKLTALKKEGGSVKWQLSLNGESVGGIVLGKNDGIYIVAGKNGSLYAVAPDGKLKWKYDIGREIENPPAIGPDGTVYITSPDLCLYAVSEKGSLKWKRRVTASAQTILTSPAIAEDGTVYFGAIKNKGYVDASDNNKQLKQNLYAYCPDGSSKWIYSTDSKEVMMPAIAEDGSIIITASSINYAGERVAEIGAAYVFSIKPDGELNWGWRAPDNELVGAPIIDSTGSIYVTSSSGYLTCISKSGTMKWRFGAGGRISIGPGKVIYVSTDNRVAAIGEKVYEKQVNSDTGIPRSEESEKTIFVYILPIMGAIGIALLLRSKSAVDKKDDNDNDNEE
jgi:PKD repeat protein